MDPEPAQPLFELHMESVCATRKNKLGSPPRLQPWTDSEHPLGPLRTDQWVRNSEIKWIKAK